MHPYYTYDPGLLHPDPASLFHRWLAIEDAISEQGWTLVLLLRAAPFVPCCVLNYTLALTSVRCGLCVECMQQPVPHAHSEANIGMLP